MLCVNNFVVYCNKNFFSVKRSRRSEKGNKGLRHFSMKVCEKVEQKGTTSYNEVADELVAEFAPANTLTNTDQVCSVCVICNH